MSRNTGSSAKYIEQALARALDGTLRRRGPTRTDGTFSVDLEARGRLIQLRALDGGQGRPTEVRRLIENRPDVWPDDLVVVARELTQASIEMLEEVNANWADETGRAHIVAPDVVVLREIATARPLRPTFRWSASAFSIGEALLSKSWYRGISTGFVAKILNWSPSQVTEVLQAFDDQGWTRKVGPQRGPGSRRDLVDVDGLLDAWSLALAASEPERRLAHQVATNMLELLQSDLSESLNEHVRWAVSGWGASELLAPIMNTIPTLQIYVAEDDFYGPLSEALHAVGLREVDEGGRIEFWAASETTLALAEVSDDIAIVSAPRAYGDLLRMGGRAEEAAEQIRNDVILPRHRPYIVKPPSQRLERWEKDSRARLGELVGLSGGEDPYERGAWSASYRLGGMGFEPDPRRFIAILNEEVRPLTGWPVFGSFGDADITRPHISGEVIESWATPSMFPDPGHRDFWRASPQGLLFLLRGYQEDGDMPGLVPGATLDFTLPIWRIGEALLHAHRVAQRCEAERIEFLARWTGLEQRALVAAAAPERFMPSGKRSLTPEVQACVEVRTEVINEQLPELVQRLVQPLFDAFDFFQPVGSLFDEELGKLRA